MKQSTAIGLCAVPVTAATHPLVSQTPPANTPPSARKRGPENLPWTRSHPATPPYPPTDSEKHQTQAKMGQLGPVIGGRQPWRGHRGLSPGRPLENAVPRGVSVHALFRAAGEDFVVAMGRPVGPPHRCLVVPTRSLRLTIRSI